MVNSRRKKSASTTKSNTPTTSPRARSESKELREKGPSNKQVNENSSERKKPEKTTSDSKRPSRTSAPFPKPILRSRFSAQNKNDAPKSNPKKAHKPSPLSIDGNSLSSERSKEQEHTDKLDSTKELESIAELPDEKIYNPIRRWSVSSEILLLKCLADNKPSGIHKHFHMANICYLFNKNNASPRSSKEIWDHVDSMYDLQAIDEMEFSGPDEWSIFQDRILNLSQFQEFDLPEPDFKTLMDKKTRGE